MPGPGTGDWGTARAWALRPGMGGGGEPSAKVKRLAFNAQMETIKELEWLRHASRVLWGMTRAWVLCPGMGGGDEPSAKVNRLASNEQLKNH